MCFKVTAAISIAQIVKLVEERCFIVTAARVTTLRDQQVVEIN